ncbi:Asp-tRNA(Asn)/Glu-tRNA(Gln) amidotransferase subunit GatC [candidate division KSB1 bacterium]|nr:Asp-tRNA(Asn)/Glu-tRNA(Gln) amidotransferase subunit GatC [candidate division KSB1 bacterium]NIR68815.1 Asp-tRNA(Asn)/Glu-tRNA(Gln) amidotransferase subunit GatC [candidate division KSB1 bacterium]NIS27178.1 Asp-tRNA(Asn)/Glu-tRNA(Gln) amidotransferase subunit GatC [candidate division KSB1 bacterium]NIT74063.1 Asp-tRNA(Asn)/Glu-tRNA(Gln) amidotransferase subunit GatC [candidate division KSB1 bacterium]NIU26928.1 Asp-tRNA(Asn)/Glu-tRNA(Gln) amidotransferase subunit GatC [candidate division KS
MPISVEEVEKIAVLAKLGFTAQEKQSIAKQLDQIVTYIEKLNELDTEHVPPTLHVLELKNVFREDEVDEWLAQEEVVQNAPAHKKGFFGVPKVIK